VKIETSFIFILFFLSFLFWSKFLWNVSFRRFLLFLIKVTTSRLFQKPSQATWRSRIFWYFSNLSNSCFDFFFLLDQKVGLTARNHATYPKLQSNIRLKLCVLESIKKTKQIFGGLESGYFTGWGKYEKKKFFLIRFLNRPCQKKISTQRRKSHNLS